MREADFEGRQTQFTGAGGGGAVQMHGGFAATVVQDFELAPEHAAHAGAERLGNGFLAGEPGGQLFGPATAVALFALGVDAAKEAFTEAVQRSLDAGNFDGVDASGEAAAGGANSR